MARRDFPDVITSVFMLTASQMDTAPDVTDHVKDRMAVAIAEEIAKHLMNSPGGALYSPLTFTIRTEVADVYAVCGTVNAVRLPDPATGEVRLVGGPMHDAVMKVGDPMPRILSLPVMQALGWTGPESMVAHYERVPGTQGYRFLEATKG